MSRKQDGDLVVIPLAVAICLLVIGVLVLIAFGK